jgi:trk system potassium uptake protein
LTAEPSIRALAPEDQFWNAVFTVMSAGTTVGFNSVPVATLAPAVIVILYLIMVFGASPGGTGGGLKSSTLAIMAALVVSTLRRRSRVTLLGLEILPDKIQQASASVAFYCLLIGIAIFALLLTETASFEDVLFEAISSLSGIGMSMGLTPALTDAGKAIVIALMVIGRVGILAFGIAIATRDPRDHDPEDADVVL